MNKLYDNVNIANLDTFYRIGKKEGRNLCLTATSPPPAPTRCNSVPLLQSRPSEGSPRARARLPSPADRYTDEFMTSHIISHHASTYLSDNELDMI